MLFFGEQCMGIGKHFNQVHVTVSLHVYVCVFALGQGILFSVYRYILNVTKLFFRTDILLIQTQMSKSFSSTYLCYAEDYL